ncbi:hypothetical protein D3C87_243980 [compost metagenome]
MKYFRFLYILLSLFVFQTMNAQRKPVKMSQADSRFTISAEKHYGFGNEEYWFFIQNNTNSKYELVVEVTLNSSCHESRSFKLDVNGVVTLMPGGRWTPKSDWVHSYLGGDAFKDCRKKDGDSYTYLTGITYRYVSITNVTEEEIKKAKEEEEKKAKLAAEKKAKEEAEMKAKLEAEQKAKLEAEQKVKEEVEKKAKEEVERKKALEEQEKAAVAATAASKGANDLVSKGEEGNAAEQKEKEEEEKEAKREEAAARERERQEAVEREEERKRQEEQARTDRQREYDNWKAQKQKEQSEYESQAMESTFTLFTLLGGFIYEGMGNVNPDFVFKDYKKAPQFYFGIDLGFSFSNIPMIFASNLTTMIGGEYETQKELQQTSAYTLNLDFAIKMGLDHKYYGAYGYFAPKVGISPIFDGHNVSLVNAGGNVYAGAKWVKLFVDYSIGTRSFGRTSNNAEEYGSGTLELNYTKLVYGLRFTTNPDSNFCRSHILVGIIEEEVTVADQFALYDPEMLSLKYDTKSEKITGYTIQWKKDNNSNMYLNLYPEYVYSGEVTGDSGSLDSIFKSSPTGLFIEFGFIRSFDFW